MRLFSQSRLFFLSNRGTKHVWYLTHVRQYRIVPLLTCCPKHHWTPGTEQRMTAWILRTGQIVKWCMPNVWLFVITKLNISLNDYQMLHLGMKKNRFSNIIVPTLLQHSALSAALIPLKLFFTFHLYGSQNDFWSMFFKQVLQWHASKARWDPERDVGLKPGVGKESCMKRSHSKQANRN